MLTNGRDQTGSKVLFLIALLAALVLTPGVARAQPNVLTGSERAQVRARPAAEGVRLVSAAFILVDFARKNASPEALVAAARMLASVGTTALKAVPTEERSAGVPQVSRRDTRPVSRTCDPAALLEEARTMSAGDPDAQASIRRVGHKLSVRRDAAGGPSYALRMLPALTSHVYTIEFLGAEYARVAVKGDGGTDLDLAVYDEGGNLVACDTDPGDTCFAEWVPERTGRFSIHVLNRDGLDNQYEIVSN